DRYSFLALSEPEGRLARLGDANQHGAIPGLRGRGRRPGLSSHRRLVHAAVLVLLAAAARARVVAADALAAVADRLLLLVALLTARDRRVLLATHAALVGQRQRRWRRLVDRRADRPQRLLEPLRLLHAEDRVRHLILHALPHGVEFLHALALVDRLRVLLGVAAQADRRAQVVHRVEVVLPRRIELVQQQAALHAAHLGAVLLVEGVPQHLPGLVLAHAGQVGFRHLHAQP